MKKIISLLICVSLFFNCYFNSNATSTPKDDITVLSEEEIVNMKENYNFALQEEKIEYLNDVFETIGANVNVNMISNELLNKLINADEFGCSDVSENAAFNNSARANGSAGKDHGDVIHLGILWGKTGNEYTILGSAEWLDLPTVRDDDIISVDLGAGSIDEESPELCLYYEKNGTVEYENFDENDDNYKGEETACVFEFDLPSSVDSISVLVSYSIVNSSDENTITLLYFHKFLPLPISVGVSYIGGVSLTFEDIFTRYPLQCGTYQGDDY